MQEPDHDVVIIGGGVSGCAIARELSRLKARVLVVEREDDVCCGTSKANSAIVHAGYDAQTGSLMARPSSIINTTIASPYCRPLVKARARQGA